jgi:hypothetical protein
MKSFNHDQTSALDSDNNGAELVDPSYAEYDSYVWRTCAICGTEFPTQRQTRICAHCGADQNQRQRPEPAPETIERRQTRNAERRQMKQWHRRQIVALKLEHDQQYADLVWRQTQAEIERRQTEQIERLKVRQELVRLNAERRQTERQEYLDHVRQMYGIERRPIRMTYNDTAISCGAGLYSLEHAPETGPEPDQSPI